MIDNPLAKAPVTAPFALAPEADQAAARAEHVHLFGSNGLHRCDTDDRGYATPKGADLTELVLDTHMGFIPLWAQGVTLRWRFNERSFALFQHPEAAKEVVRELMRKGLSEWGSATPVQFSEQRDVYDFEVVMMANADCDNGGCVLASAFFPDGGRHELKIYPTLFDYPVGEQIETLAHEFGHVFGLRHWFAKLSESPWPSTVFGSDARFTIMNYGDDSRMTDADRNDLVALYASVWNGTLTEINRTPIRLFKPYSANL